MELAGVGHPLVDQDEAGAVRVEQLTEPVARIRRPLVILSDELVGLPRLLGAAGRLAELPRQLAPQRVHPRSVGLLARVAGRDLVAHQDGPVRLRDRLHPRFLEHLLDAHQPRWVGARDQVVEGQHRVRLAAAEVGLELHHRVTRPVGHAPRGPGQQPPQALRHERPPEELGGVAVLGRAAAEVDLPQVGRELGLLVPPARHVAVGLHQFAPGPERPGRRALQERATGLPLVAAHLLVDPQPRQL